MPDAETPKEAPKSFGLKSKISSLRQGIRQACDHLVQVSQMLEAVAEQIDEHGEGPMAQVLSDYLGITRNVVIRTAHSAAELTSHAMTLTVHSTAEESVRNGDIADPTPKPEEPPKLDS